MAPRRPFPWDEGCPPEPGWQWRPLHKYGQTSNRKHVRSDDGGASSFVYIHGLDEPRTATLSFKANGPIPAGGTVLLTVDTLSFNGAKFTRYFQVSTVERRVRLVGTGFLVKGALVTLSLVAANADGSPTTTAGPPGGDVEISVALNDQVDDPDGDLLPIWNTTPVTVGNAENRYAGAGTLLAATFTLQALGGSAELWLFIFDNPSFVAAQAAAQQPLIPPPLFTAAGQNADFSGALRVAGQFNTGLSWLLSTTANVPSLPAVGAIGRFDWLQGW